MYKSSSKIKMPQLILSLILMTSNGFAANSSAKTSKTPPASTAAIPGKKIIKVQGDLVEGISAEDIKKYNNQLRATELILKSEKSEAKREELYIRRAIAHIMLARYIGLKRSDKDKLSIDESNHIESALKVLNFYEPKFKNAPSKLSEIYYMRGLIALENNQQDKMADYYKKVIAMDPNNKIAVGISIMLGEYYYDTDRYKDAIYYYQLYPAKLTPFQKALADYKSAWCYLGLKDIKLAQYYFVKIINSNEMQFKEDSIKDLAFLLIQYSTEAEVLQFLHQNIKENASKIKFLTSAFEAYVAKDNKQTYQLLYDEILKYDLPPLEKVRIHMMKISCDRREYPNQKAWVVLGNIDKSISDLSKEDTEKFKFSSYKQLEDHSIHLIRVYSEAFNGKLQNPEKISRTELLNTLLSLIDFHLKRFPQSETKQFIVSLWIDVCRETSNLGCLSKIQSYLEKQDQPDKTKKNVNLDNVLLAKMNVWDSAYTKEPDKFRDGYKKECLNYLAARPEGPESLKIRKRLYGMYVAEKNDTAAADQANEIYKRQATPENLKIVILLLVKMKKYDELKKYESNIEASHDHDIKDAYRETFLRKAMAAKESNNFGEYQTNLKYYLSKTTDKKKRMIVVSDLIYELVKKNESDEIEKEWLSLSVQERRDPVFDDFKEKMIYNMFESKKIKELADLDQPLRRPFAQLLYKASFNHFTRADWKNVFALKEKERLYFINNYLFQNPAEVYTVLRGQKTLSNAEKAIALNALYLKSGSMSVAMGPKERQWFGSLAPTAPTQYKKSKLISRYKEISWPTPEMSEKKYGAKIEKIALDLRYLRKKVMTELPLVSMSDRIALLTEAESAEKKCADMLVNSPIPKELAVEQIDQYKNELKGVADGYVSQAGEFHKILAELETNQKKVSDEQETKKLPDFDSSQWPWSAYKSSEDLITMSKQVSLFVALVCLDRDLEDKKITSDVYYTARTGLIASHFSGLPIKEYLRQELEGAGQQDLLVKWRKMNK